VGRFTGVRMDSVRAYRPRSVEAGPGVHLRDRPRPSEDARLGRNYPRGRTVRRKAAGDLRRRRRLRRTVERAAARARCRASCHRIFRRARARLSRPDGARDLRAGLRLGGRADSAGVPGHAPTDAPTHPGRRAPRRSGGGHVWPGVGPEVALGGRRSAWSRRRFRILRQRIVRSRRARLDRCAAAALRCMAHPALRRGARRRGRRRRAPSGFLDARAFRAVAGTGSRGSRS